MNENNITSDEVQAESKKQDGELPEVRHEDSLELHYMSLRERFAAKRAKYKEEIQDMGPGRRIGHFMRYYKWFVIIPAIVLACVIAIIITVHRNLQPVGLSYMILNVKDEDVLDTSFYEDFVAQFDIPDNYQETSSTTYHVKYADYLEREDIYLSSSSTDYYRISTNCEAGNFDVIITDMDGLKYLSRIDIIQVLSNTLDSSVYDSLEKYIVYVDGPYGSETFGLDISDTDFARGLNTGYSKVYIAIPSNTACKSNKNALRLLEYIYGIDITE